MVRDSIAVWFIVLCVLPFTAPFATCGPCGPYGTPDDITHYAVGMIEAPAVQSDDDSVVVAAERTSLAERSKLCVGVAVASFDSASVVHLILPSVALRPLTDHTPPLSILRV
jgi:hypothetical protein